MTDTILSSLSTNMPKSTLIRPNILDLLKIIAIILMIIDHIGYFILTEYSTLRLIGRFSFPLFFIIIGVHHSYRVKRDLLAMALTLQIILSIYRYATGSTSRYLSILANVIIVKVILHQIETLLITTKNIKINKTHTYRILSCISLIATSIIPRTAWWLEYGSVSISLWIRGYLLAARAPPYLIWIHTLISIIGSIIINGHVHFLPHERWILVTGLTVMMSAIRIGYPYLYHPINTIKPIKNLIQRTSQYSLYIYMLHIPMILALAWIIQ